MSVALTGTPTYVVNKHYDDSSQAVTIPADCEAVVVISWGYRSSYALDFDKLNWDNGATVDFDLVCTQKSTSEPYDVWAYVMTSANGDWPGTGAKTLYFGFNNTPTEGGQVVIIFVKGLDTASPVRDTETYKSNASGDDEWITSLSGVDADDLTIGAMCNYAGTPDTAPSGSGQTELVSASSEHTVDYSVGYESGEDAFDMTDGANVYLGWIVFALKVASGVADLNISVHDCGEVKGVLI